MRTTSVLPLTALALATLSLAGCDEADLASDIAFRPGSGSGCSYCSLNSPTINDAYVAELNLDGKPNIEGVRLLNIADPRTDTLYAPHIDDHDRLVARDDQGDPIFTGDQLVGKVLSLQTPDGPRTLKIVGYDDAIPTWSTTGSPITIYRLQYRVAGVAYPICPNSEGQNKEIVTLIAGETYDRDTNEIHSGMPRWFSLACVGEAAYKMKLMDYHPRGNRHASVDQRQATLRMITADYCGDGTAYTVDGTPVGWRNADESVVPTVAEDELEAKWGPDGALCLDTPRYADPAEIHCSIPSCDGDTTFGPGIEWRTMLP
ncbi:MAG: ADYC domain-containing protein [Nannocystaceae bacterium]